MKTKDKPVLIVAVHEPSRISMNADGYYHVSVGIGRLVDTRDEDWCYQEVEFICPQYVDGLYVEHLLLQSQGKRGQDFVFSCGLRYRDLTSAGRTEADGMAKTLRLLETRMAKIRQDAPEWERSRTNQTENFIEDVIRLAKAVGAVGIYYLPKNVDITERQSQFLFVSMRDGSAPRDVVEAVVYKALRRYGMS